MCVRRDVHTHVFDWLNDSRFGPDTGDLRSQGRRTRTPHRRSVQMFVGPSAVTPMSPPSPAIVFTAHEGRTDAPSSSTE